MRVRIISDERDYRERYREERRCRRLYQDVCQVLLVCLVIMAVALAWKGGV
ncbi:hypothetical protein [Clostridium sp. AM58-1XD]|uniref:hypothetical protein n=1 Tax=Clostridium sp. AM58-1XD TaxID=2292307 RepID=UPI0015F5B523|nr:hypothetical protein [Clostridium sp. AM58-1XD]